MNQYRGHEIATDEIIKQNLPQGLANQIYQGGPSQTQNNSGGYSQQAGYTGQQGFSGYGSPNPSYGTSYQQNYQGVGYQQQSYGGSPQGYAGQQGQQWRMVQPSQDLLARLPKVGGVPIVAVHKNGQGDIEAFRLQNGQILDYVQMLEANGRGELSGLRVQENREGELIIRSVPDGYTDNNLDNLPQF